MGSPKIPDTGVDFLSDDMLKSAIYTSDVIVIPSLYEPFGLAALESMAYAKPIVASNVGGLSEILTNNKNSLLVPPADENELVKKILKLIKDEDLAKRLGKNAKKDVKNYDWNKIIDDIINVYEN